MIPSRGVCRIRLTALASSTRAGVLVTVIAVAVTAVTTEIPLFAAFVKPEAVSVSPTRKPRVMNDEEVGAEGR
jgi:hypothetical protein